MKKILPFWTLLFFSLIVSNFTHAQVEENPCEHYYTITGEHSVIINTDQKYTVIDQKNQQIDNGKVSYFLDDKKISSDDNILYYNFPNTGNITLTAKITEGACNQEAVFSIKTFDKHLLYLGAHHEAFDLGFFENIANAGYLLETIDTDFKESTLEKTLPANKIKTANPIIINDKGFNTFLEYYTKLDPEEKGTSKNIMILTNDNPKLLKRRLSQYANLLASDILYIVQPSDFLNLLSDISLNNEYLEKPYITTFSRDFKDSPQWMVFSYLVDLMLKNNFPIEILGILLSLAAIVLVISMLRQLFGFSVFGVYWPLFFSLLAMTTDWKLILFLLLIGIIATAIVHGISKKLYLLSSAKISIQITLFIILFAFAYAYNQHFPIFDQSILNSPLTIFALILIPIISYRALPPINLIHKGWWIALLEFLFISLISYGLFLSNGLRSFLLSYPEMLILILILEIIVGRYGGLQLFEIFRFIPLIKRHLEDDEE